MSDHFDKNKINHVIDLKMDQNQRAKKEKIFQLQQKRLQQMAFSKINQDLRDCGSLSADSMINNILQNSKNMKPEINMISCQFNSIHHSNSHQNDSSSNSTTFSKDFHFPQSLATDHDDSKLFKVESNTEHVLNLNLKIDSSNGSSLNFPEWCPSHPSFISNQSNLPPIYLKVWNLVKLNEKSNLCDTARLYPILLSSQLTTNLLANIWSQVNQTVPGQLTFQELILSLALVGLHQCHQNSNFYLSHLLNLKHAPNPYLQLPSENSISSDSKVNPLLSKDICQIDQILEENNKINNFDEDFADFQSFQPINDNNQIDNWYPFQSSQFLKKKKDSETAEKISSESKSKPKVEIDKENSSKTTSNFFQSSLEDTKNNSSTEQQELIQVLDSFLLTHKFEKTPSKLENIQNENENKTMNQSENVDRYQAFKDLFKETLEKSDDEFGEFKSHSKINEIYSKDETNLNENNEKIKIWIQVLKCTKQLIHKVFNVLIVNHGEEGVIEALSTEEGNQYILDLAEVYRVSRRIFNYYLQNSSPHDLIVELMDDINLTWRSLKKLFDKVPIEINFKEDEKDSNPAPNLNEICTICCTFSDGILFLGNRYHSSCANLWLNCIESTLPVPTFKMNQKFMKKDQMSS